MRIRVALLCTMLVLIQTAVWPQAALSETLFFDDFEGTSPLDNWEQPVLQPVHGVGVAHIDGKTVCVKVNDPAAPQPSVKGGTGHLQLELSEDSLPELLCVWQAVLY